MFIKSMLKNCAALAAVFALSTQALDVEAIADNMAETTTEAEAN